MDGYLQNDHQLTTGFYNPFRGDHNLIRSHFLGAKHLLEATKEYYIQIQKYCVQ